MGTVNCGLSLRSWWGEFSQPLNLHFSRLYLHRGVTGPFVGSRAAQGQGDDRRHEAAARK